MNRIEKKFEELKANGKKAFIGFVTAGDPTLAKTPDLVYALEAGGCDIVELGVPYSDPLADGPVIQAAAMRALSNPDLSVNAIMETVKEIRKNTEVPLAFLVYINTILVYGKEKFIKACEEVGIDGLIIPDMPLEERDELLDIIENTNIALIPLVAPTSKGRIEKVVAGCKGFVYCVSSLGVTGRSSNFYGGINDYLEDVKKKSSIPTAVGFGISSREDVDRLAPYADAVIVGSAIVRKVEEGNGDPEIVKEFVEELTKNL